MTRAYPKRTHSSTIADRYGCGRCGRIYRKRSEADKCCGLERGTKTRILKRDKKQCVICGSTAKLNIHHIESGVTNPYRNTRDEDLVTLCVSCHMKIHAMPKKTLAKLLREIVSQKFGGQKPSLILVGENWTIEFIEAKEAE